MTKPLPKIKKCQKCGVSQIRYPSCFTQRYRNGDVRDKVCAVVCGAPRCNCIGPYRKTVRGAINAWNRRVTK